MPPETPATVRVVVGDKTLEVPPDQAAQLVAQGGHVESQGEREDARSTAHAEELNPAPGALLAAGLGVVRTGSFGLSDVAYRAAGFGEDVRRAKEAHPYATLGGELAGVLIPGTAVGKLGKAVEAGVAGEGAIGAARAIAARGAGMAAEGGVYGLGQGVSELALSKDPLTAEHVLSTLSSNVLLGGGIGGVAGSAFKTVELGFAKASAALREASATRAALEGVPADLRALDDAGLKAARKTAEAEHAADIAAEKQSLEQLRVEQRAELANQVKDLHENLAKERPIYSALSSNDELTPALKGIEGVADARVQLAKSFKSVRAAFDNPLSVQRDPMRLITPLEQREGALTALQEKLPEMHAALAGDARAAVLEHIDSALAETKQQISAIRSLSSKENPVMSGRLAALQGGPSARMQAIDAARDALAKAPELGFVGKGAKGAAFAGATAVAHMIPGVGMAAPFVGKYAADAVERLFTRTAGAVGKVSGKAAAAAEKFLGATKALEPYVAPSATKVLGAVRFGPSSKKQDQTEEPTKKELHELFAERTGELYAQTMRAPDGSTVMRPDARVAMAGMLDGVRHVNPVLADQLETLQARKTAYYAQIAPKKPEPAALQIGPDTSRPSDMAIRQWARAVRAGEDPASVEERLARGYCTPEEAHCFQTLFPARHAELVREIFTAAPHVTKTWSMGKKVALSIFSGVAVTPAMQPNVIAVLQSTFNVEPGSAGGTRAPGPAPRFGSFGSVRDIDKPTPSQARAAGGARR